MFTGLIQHCGVIENVSDDPAGVRLEVNLDGWDHSPSPGDSIAVNGCCLTVAAFDAKTAGFNVVPETLRLTTLGALKAGERVNLEHAVTVQTLLGGHIVQGHVDGIGTILQVIKNGDERRLRIQAPEQIQDEVVLKGSVTVEGVSLTVAVRQDDWFEVALIPETLSRTTLGLAGVNQRVNLEADYIARIVISWLERRSPK